MLDRPLNSGSRPNLATTIAWLLLPALMIPIGLGSSARAQIPCRYEVTHIIQGPVSPTWGAPYTAGTSISPSGRFVCGYYTYIGSFFAFVYDTTTNQFRTLPYDASPFTMAKDVNDEYVVGTVGLPSGNRGFIYNIATGQSVLLAGVLPQVGYGASISAINASNVVCGTRTIGGPPNYLTSAFIWTAQNGFTDLGLINGASTFAADINDSSVVTGTMGPNGSQQPFIWQNGKLVELGTLSGLATFANAIDNSNRVVGNGTTQSVPTLFHALLVTNSTMLDLGVLPGFDRSNAFDISENGLIVGWCTNFVWADGQMVDLRNLVPNYQFSVEFAAAVSDAGWIVGSGTAPTGVAASFVIVPIAAPVGDVTHDCRVNVNDLLSVINDWGLNKSPADLDRDGIVGLSDLMVVINHWTFGS